LLDAVERHLEEASFTEAKVEQIANDAGMSRSAFYIHFADKSELLRTLYAGVVEELIESSRTWWDLPPSASKDDVREGFRVLFTAYRRHSKLMRAVAEVAAYDEAVGAEFDVMMQQAVGEVTQHISDGQKNGSIRGSLDAKGTAICLTWMTERVLLQVIGGATDDEVEGPLAAMVDIYWHTLYEGHRGQGRAAGRSPRSGAVNGPTRR
jgi:AcrR family transcriptional regulator